MPQRSHRPRRIPRRALLAAGTAFAGGAAFASPPGQSFLGTIGWWVGNDRAPDVKLVTPAEVMRGDVTIQVEVENVPSWSFVEATIDGTSVAASRAIAVNTRDLSDGAHTIRVAVRDNSLRRNVRYVEALLVTDNTPPQVTLDTKAPGGMQGRTVLVQAKSDEPAAIDLVFGNRTLPFSREGAAYVALVGFDPLGDAGKQPVKLIARDRAGNETTQNLTFDLAAGAYPAETLVVPADLLKLITDGAYEREEKQIEAMYVANGIERLWDGEFSAPVKGVISSIYGLNRTYLAANAPGTAKSRHLGLDFDAATGTTISAPAKGRVVHAGSMTVRGTSVMLDHGIGISTVYAHMSRLDVKVGDLVDKGQPLGAVGATGLVTGPHLHFEVRIGGLAVDPAEWLRRKMI